MKKRSKSLSLLAVIGLGLVLGPTGVALAADQPLRAGFQEKESTPEEVRTVEAAALAASDPSMSLQEARASLRASELYGPVVTKIQELFPNSFGYAELGKDNVGTVHLVGDVPPGLEQIAASAPLPVRLVSDARMTDVDAAALSARLNSAVFGVMRAGAGSLHFDQASGRFQVQLYVKNGVVATTLRETAARLAAPVAGKWPVDVEVKTGDGPRPSAPLYTGGTSLSLQGQTKLVCSAAFTGTRGSYVGLISADHCPDFMSYEASQNLTYRVSAYAGDGDGAFYSGPGTIRNAVIYDRNGSTLYTKQITSTGYTAAGTTVCRYGGATAAVVCGTVKRNNDSVYYPDQGEGPKLYNRMNVMAKADKLGDSGGQVSNGAMAAGIISGQNLSTDETYFSVITYMASDMGVTVKIN